MAFLGRKIENKLSISNHDQFKKPQNIDHVFSLTKVPSVGVPFSTLSKRRSESAYEEILNKLRNDFQIRFQENILSPSEGLDKFEQIKVLGTGSFGVVFLVKRTEENIPKYYAMKCMEKLRIVKLKQLDHSLYEKKILQAVKHPFIISMECSFQDNSYLYYVMPFVSGGELFIHLRRMKRFSEGLSKFFGAQVLLALEFLHHCDVVYRDLKPENILLEETGYLKLADLGFCKVVKGRTWTLCGTPEYIAPEILLSKGYSKAVDWWSFGVFLFEMDAGYPPFTSSDPMKVYERIISRRYRCPATFSHELKDLIKNLLQIDLSRRYGNLRNGVQDIRHHKWFKEINFFAIFDKQVEAPFKPIIKSPLDTTNFDNYDDINLKKISDKNMYEKEFEKF